MQNLVSFDIMEILIFCELGLKTPKIGVLGSKIGEVVVQCWPSTNSLLLFGVVTSVQCCARYFSTVPWRY